MKTIKNLTAEQLRKSILQLAIQGKLVKQDPNDEPASELVKRIYEEKQRLIKEGKIKKDKSESYIYKGDDNRYYEKAGNKVISITDELPFDIPNSWAWIRIKEILNIKTGASFKKEQASQQFRSDKIRVLRGGNILPFRLLLKSDDLYIPKDLVNNDIFLQKNDLLTPSVTSLENIGKLCIVEEDLKNTTAGGFVFILRPYLNQAIFSKMCLLFISSPSFQLEMSEITKKSGQAFYNLSKERFSNLLLPIPPANEIGRIVNKFSSFLPLLSVYEKVETDLQKLEGNFEEKLKASILQYAIEGKLVKQDPNDEPASVLLERIKAEKNRLIKEGKIKPDKHESEIIPSDDKDYYRKLPISLPLQSVCSYGCTVFPHLPFENQYQLIELDQIKSGDSSCPSGKKCSASNSNTSRITFEKGMILYSKLRPYLDKAVLTDKNGYCSSELVPFWSYIFPDYLLLYLHSPKFISKINGSSFGVKMPRAKTSVLLSSQINVFGKITTERIVERVSALFRLIS